MALAMVLLIAGCSSSESEATATTTPPETVATTTTTTTTTTAPTTTTVAATTTSTIPELTLAQEIYCEDLTSIVSIKSPAGGRQVRPETVTFMEIAHRLGYLHLPLTLGEMGPSGRKDANGFVLYSMSRNPLAHDVGDEMRDEWKRNLGNDVPFETAFAETCLVAWELR